MHAGTTGELAPTVGDPLPPRIADLYQALGAGDPERAEQAFAADGVCALPGERAEETAPRSIFERQNLAKAFAADPFCGHSHQVRISAHESPDVLLEGLILDADGGLTQTFASSIRLDPEGRIRRCLIYRCSPIDELGPPLSENRSDVDPGYRIGEYFRELAAGRFRQATACFSADCLYSHPPYFPGDSRVNFRGHDELLAGLENRGEQDWEHHLAVSVTRGPHLLVEGYTFLDRTPHGRTGSFLSVASLDTHGRIQRYVAFYCAPMVPQR